MGIGMSLNYLPSAEYKSTVTFRQQSNKLTYQARPIDHSQSYGREYQDAKHASMQNQKSQAINPQPSTTLSHLRSLTTASAPTTPASLAKEGGKSSSLVPQSLSSSPRTRTNSLPSVKKSCPIQFRV